MKKVLLGLAGVVALAAPVANAAVIELEIVPGGSTTNLVSPLPTNAKLLYDPSNGNVQINAFGFAISGFNLQDNVADAVNVFAGSAAPTFPGGALSTTDNDTKVAWATISQPFNTTHNLGNIAVTGLTPQDLILQLSAVAAPLGSTDSYYTVQGNAGRNSFDIAVPEPTALGLAAIAGLGLLARRRRAL